MTFGQTIVLTIISILGLCLLIVVITGCVSMLMDKRKR